ncbi:MAG TPA: prephenate dehydratase [Bryobacteraceae bacterium]|nr:prephenate dehydratase [Bryobacteraceae bacterium]
MRKRSKTKVAFQGEPGAFSHAAARKLLGPDVDILPCPRFDEVFGALQAKQATHAVIPIENTLHGSVHENYDHLLEYDLPIVGETSIRISHQLIAMPGTRFRDVRRVLSHPVALNQCVRFFKEHPDIEKVPHYDTAGSVKTLADERPPHSAAIASAAAAEIYGGVILKRGIEDDRQNFTRFFLLDRRPLKRTSTDGGWKTSVVFSTPNHPGSLFRAMACFALRDLNLTKIESRPLRGKPWEYLFYVDLIGHSDDIQVANALNNLKEISNMLRILGSYQPMD